MFQSYLYGIEMNELLSLSNTLHECFNRTFMELKSQSFRAPLFRPACFNRTFMELKSSQPQPFSPPVSFQSYLYGIEIHSEQLQADNRGTFQSYLYGIEIALPSLQISLVAVSIVPLWN